jgi:hypothetical protein
MEPLRVFNAVPGNSYLVGEKDDGNGLIRARNVNLRVNIVLPLGNGLERRHTSHVKDNECSDGFFVVYLQ